MTGHQSGKGPALPEFVAMMALLMSITALSIDAMLPALPLIGADLAVADPADTQLVVSALFAGLALGQIVYGPLSDSTGRKPAVYLGMGLFLAGCLISIFAEVYWLMLAGRALQGFGAASARIVTVALVRDSHAGRAMARIMSFIMAVFIVVPILAPMVGQLILFSGSWRLIFMFFLVLGASATLWFAWRQPETLTREKRRLFSLAKLAEGFRIAASNRITLGYTVAVGFIFAPFLAYLSAAQQIFQDQYGAGDLFVIYFAAGAIAVGLSSIVNGRIVMRIGMRRLLRFALCLQAGASLALIGGALLAGSDPTLGWLMVYFVVVFFGTGMLFGNMNAIAMEPMGQIAGIASAFVGFFSSAIGLPIGILIGRAIDGTVLPLAVGFALCASLSLAVGFWADKGLPPRPIGEG